MIARAVGLVVGELRAFIASEEAPGALDEPEFAIPGNIAQADVPDLSPPIGQRIVVSVVNVAEEASFKNSAHYERVGTATRYRNAPSYLNLFLLFSANYDNYSTALRRLSQVVTFFQGKNVFDVGSAVVPPPTEPSDEDIRLVLELFALTFEQVNYLWASLGGKQMPFVLYKARVVRVQADRTLGTAPVVEEAVSREAGV